MGDLRGDFYGMIMGYLPDVDVHDPNTVNVIKLAVERLQIVLPIISALDGVPPARGTPNRVSLTAALAKLLEVQACQVAVRLVRPEHIAHMPRKAKAYSTLLSHLVAARLEAVTESAVAKLGAETVERLKRDFWHVVGDALIESQYKSYRTFCGHVEASIHSNFALSRLNAVLTLVMAVVIGDRPTIEDLNPLLRQLPFCQPVGNLVGDEQEWYVIQPDAPEEAIP